MLKTRRRQRLYPSWDNPKISQLNENVKAFHFINDQLHRSEGNHRRRSIWSVIAKASGGRACGSYSADAPKLSTAAGWKSLWWLQRCRCSEVRSSWHRERTLQTKERTRCTSPSWTTSHTLHTYLSFISAILLNQVNSRISDGNSIVFQFRFCSKRHQRRYSDQFRSVLVQIRAATRVIFYCVHDFCFYWFITYNHLQQLPS